jgi:hypothetical protein
MCQITLAARYRKAAPRIILQDHDSQQVERQLRNGGRQESSMKVGPRRHRSDVNSSEADLANQSMQEIGKRRERPQGRPENAF